MFLKILASIELKMDEIYGNDSMVAACGTAAEMDDFVGSLLTPEATKSCAQGTDGYVRCLGMTGGCAVPMKLETGGLQAMVVMRAVTGDDDDEGMEISDDGGRVRGGIGNDGRTCKVTGTCKPGRVSDTT